MKTVRMYREDGKFVDVPEGAADFDVYRKNWPLSAAPTGDPVDPVDKGDGGATTEGGEPRKKGKKA